MLEINGQSAKNTTGRAFPADLEIRLWQTHQLEIVRHEFRTCFEMVRENNYSLFFSGFFVGLKEQWGSIVAEKQRKMREKEA